MIEAHGEVTARQLTEAMGRTGAWGAQWLLKLYRGRLVRRRPEPARGQSWQFVYWISEQGLKRLRWSRGG